MKKISIIFLNFSIEGSDETWIKDFNGTSGPVSHRASNEKPTISKLDDLMNNSDK